jgi:hypothetical protein
MSKLTIQSKIIKSILLKYLSKKYRNIAKQRKFLIDCIASSGYTIEKIEPVEEVDEEDEYADLYAHFMPNTTNQSVSSKNENDLRLSLQEQESSSIDPYGFNRTFISTNSRQADKLAELQKRGITYEETQFTKAKEQMEYLIEIAMKGNIDAPLDKILQSALNMYLNIMIYYTNTENPNPYNLNEIKGSLKKGYLFMCVYYSLIFNGYYMDREKLMEQSEKIRFRDLPLAERNMKRIFEGIHGYDFLNNSFHGTYNPGNFLSKSTNIQSKELIQIIEKVIEETKSFVPSTKLGIYSLLYFVCNEYLPYKVKIMFKGLETRVTYKVLDSIFGTYASATVRKITDQLLRYYRN